MVTQVDLSNWQTRLEKHFSELQLIRNKSAPDQPIFAIEHGLNKFEVQALQTEIRTHIQETTPSRDHVLPWIVYATEFGYRYSGDQYWQTFDSETPGWIEHGSRYWIRECFDTFHAKYNGAKPSGRWADHFSIICWPITNAILPQDLQRQLARILYEMRHRFSAELFESPSKLGELIAAQSWSATSRFQNLAEQTMLVGQISAALLLQGGFGTDSLIYSDTLHRISEDLDRERRSRDWLRDARRFAREGTRIRGVALNRRPTSKMVGRPEEARAELDNLGIEPRVVLCPKDISGTLWKVLLEIPDLTHLLIRFPQTREILMGSRCIVAGTDGHPLARGRCLHGAQRITLTRWPSDDEVLLQFEKRNPQLEFLFRTDCLLRPGTERIFRIASDGLAYELYSRLVRAGERYVIISTAGQLKDNAYAKQVIIECKGVDGKILEIPAAITNDWEETLRTYNIGKSKTIDVWPAGLAAVDWDGEGHSQWFSFEQPCLAIRTDHQVDSLQISIPSSIEPTLELMPIVTGETVFVELPRLPVGLHTVRISTRKSKETDVESIGDLDILIRIIEVQPWSFGINPQGPLLVYIYPTTPTLEQLWEGNVEIMLYGPMSRRIKCKVSLFEKDEGTLIIFKQLPSVSLPLTPDGWRGYFEKHFRNKPDVQKAYDYARVCELEFDAEELGAFTVSCEREFTPLRWIVRRNGNNYVVWLVDDSGNIIPPEISRLSFENPSIMESLKSASEYEVPNAGGLYIARKGEFMAGVIAPQSGHSLADLKCCPYIDSGEFSVESIIDAIRLTGIWGHARISGDIFSVKRQRDVLLAFIRHIFKFLCGDNWGKAEERYIVHNGELRFLEDAVSRRSEEAAISIILSREAKIISGYSCEDRIDFLASLADRYRLLTSCSTLNIITPKWLFELSLRLASDPMNIEVWAGDRLRIGLIRLREVPTLARAARFLVIVMDQQLQPLLKSGELYVGWRWA